MPRQTTDRDTTWFIDQDGKTWTLTANATIETTTGAGIQAVGQSNDIRVLGSIFADGHGIHNSSGTTYVGKNATVAGESAILAGLGGRVENHGHLHATGFGVYTAFFDVSLRVRNSGTIDSSQVGVALLNSGTLSVVNTGRINGGQDAIRVSNGESTVTNGQDGVITAGDTAISVTNGGTSHSIVNNGLIQGAVAAIAVEGGSDVTIRNTGIIVGNISLGNGADRIDTRGGIVRGEIHGGGGDDLYLVSSSRIRIVDNGASFDDTVRSTASFALTGGLDHLTLLGNRNVDGIGNIGANDIRGNTGDNRLDGGVGNDRLSGKAGNDRLTGGTDDDLFIFNRGFDVDRITDFEDGSDLIVSNQVTSQKQFDRLDIRQVGDNVVIDFGNGDRLVIEGLTKSALDFSDFAID